MEKREMIDSSFIEDVLFNCYQRLTLLRHGVKNLEKDTVSNRVQMSEVADFLTLELEMLDFMNDEILKIKGNIPHVLEVDAATTAVPAKMDFVDEFMKGRISWGESPTHDWDNKVMPAIQKFTALYALMDHGAYELIEGGWPDDYARNIAVGLAGIFGEILVTLENFGKELPEKVETLLRKNLEKAAAESDSNQSYRATIESMLFTPGPAIQQVETA